jgi:hypothetical protein
MFELLLQADRALSGGNLDQAERTYWQLSELDPTNAIAIAGLARVALERGDIRLARIFAVRAQVMDPENVAATRIIETIDEFTAGAPSELQPIPEDPTLSAAHLLEAAGRARVLSDEAAVEGEDEAPLAGEAPLAINELVMEPLVEETAEVESPAEDTAATETAAADGAAEMDAESPTPDDVPESPIEPEQAAEPEPEQAAELPASPVVDALIDAPEEPESASEPLLPDKRRFGRELAAAAAEMEAGASDVLRRKNGKPDFRFPQITERGRRRFEPEEMKAPALADDPFAAAESEAVIEAVDAMDDVDDFASAQAPADRFEPGSDEELAAESAVEPDAPLEGMPAENAADSVALRLSILGFESGPDVGDLTPEEPEEPDDLLKLRMSLLGSEADLETVADDSSLGGEPKETESERATAEDDVIARRIASLAGDEPESTQLEAAEFDPTAAPLGIEPEVIEVAVEPEAAVEAEAETEVEAEAEAEAGTEVEAEAVVESEAVPEPLVAVEADASAEPKDPATTEPAAELATAEPIDETDLELSEREAEAAALREAVAMVLEGEGDEAGAAPPEPPADAAAPAGSEAPDPADGAAGEEPGQEPRRRGFLRRIIGG